MSAASSSGLTDTELRIVELLHLISKKHRGNNTIWQKLNDLKQNNNSAFALGLYFFAAQHDSDSEGNVKDKYLAAYWAAQASCTGDADEELVRVSKWLLFKAGLLETQEAGSRKFAPKFEASSPFHDRTWSKWSVAGEYNSSDLWLLFMGCCRLGRQTP